MSPVWWARRFGAAVSNSAGSRERDSRALRLTAAGRAGLFEAFGVDLVNTRPGSSGRSALPPGIGELQRGDIRD